MYYGMNLLVKMPLYSLTDMLTNIENVSLNEINNIIKKIFIKSNIMIGTIGKVSDKDSELILDHINKF